MQGQSSKRIFMDNVQDRKKELKEKLSESIDYSRESSDEEIQ